MRRKRTRLSELESFIIALEYKVMVPVAVICANHNCVLTTVLSAARRYGITVPRPRAKPQRYQSDGNVAR